LALVRRLRDLGLVPEAVARLREGESYFADSAEWQLEYAVTLVYLDDRDGAISRYRRALDLAPGNPQAAVELAMLLLERRGPGDLDEAGRWAQHASALAPESPSVLACLAELAALRGDLREAQALYDRAIQALPPDAVQRRVFEQRARALGR
jgi:Flp pilus assembly protein TadD